MITNLALGRTGSCKYPMIKPHSEPRRPCKTPGPQPKPLKSLVLGRDPGGGGLSGLWQARSDHRSQDTLARHEITRP
jgi:hypothetical protein